MMVRKFIVLLFLFFYCLCIFSCNGFQKENINHGIVNDTVSYQSLGKVEKRMIIIDRDIDLGGSMCLLPKGMTLVIKGGILKNGTLKGNMTKIKCQGKAFNKITIKGSWDVPNISTSMFVDLNYENALKDVFALANSKVKNTISIECGHYMVKAKKNRDACLTLSDNTELILMGIIQILPNEYPMYDIIKVKGENINIHGKGTIVGDKHTHLGTDGEWGMGIRFHGAINSSVRDLTIKDCWGDCIYVGGNSKNVLIENCMLDHGRRQGISVTKADGVTIRNCRISNVSGTNPQYAIDLEPNKNDTVDNVLIDNVKIENCEGGILATRGLKSEKTTIGSFIIRNCSLSVLSRFPIRIRRSRSALVENCIINATNKTPSIYSENINHVVIRDNTINIENSFVSSVKNQIKQLSGKGSYKPIKVVGASKKTVNNNKIFEK